MDPFQAPDPIKAKPVSRPEASINIPTVNELYYRASIVINNTTLGVPYRIYSIMGPPNPILIIQAPILNPPIIPLIANPCRDP